MRKSMSQHMHETGYVTTQEAAAILNQSMGGSFTKKLFRSKVDMVLTDRTKWWKRDQLDKVPKPDPVLSEAAKARQQRPEQLTLEEMPLAPSAPDRISSLGKELNTVINRVGALETEVTELSGMLMAVRNRLSALIQGLGGLQEDRPNVSK